MIQYPIIVSSKPRLLNLKVLNLIVRWSTGAAIVRSPNTENTVSIGACWENLPKIVKITLLQFNYEFGHGNFFTVWLSQYFQNIYQRKKIVIDGILIITSQSCYKFPVFVMFACFPFKWNHSTIYNSNLSKSKGSIPQIFNIMAALLGHLTIKFNSIKFNSLDLLVRVCDGTQSNGCLSRRPILWNFYHCSPISWDWAL